jgi:hypothetical protein
MGQWRDGNLSGGDMATAASAVLDAEYKAIMSDEVPPGLGDDTAAEKAMSDLVQWARQEELLGENVLGQLAPTLQSLLEGMYKRAQRRCANQHDLTQISKLIRGIADR